MGREQHLGDLEQLVLLAVVRLGKDAYGASVRRELRSRAGRSVAVSTVYVTLMRLEEKGLVRSGLGAPTAVRGGKAKRHFRVTEAGVERLQEERAVLRRMWDGLDDALRPADAHGR
jgi:DNA-binding PadR family transcriptional regulator